MKTSAGCFVWASLMNRAPGFAADVVGLALGVNRNSSKSGDRCKRVWVEEHPVRV